jgi:hypothetical protein
MIRPEDLRDLLKRRPFQAFRLHLSNGQSHEVKHPDLAIVMRATMIIGRPEPGTDDPIADGYDIVSVLHINKIETLPTPSKAAAGNGTH